MLLIPGILASKFTPQGDFESIATVSVTAAGGASSVDFTSIPGTFQHLQIRAIARSTAAATGLDGVFAQFNSDTGSNYARHNLIGDGASATASAATSTTVLVFGQIPKNNETANRFGAFVCDILDYANTNKYTTTRSLLGTDLNGSGQVRFTSGLWQNTAAITSIKLTSETNNLAQYSHFALYGIKG
jgi:hypothetical protein